MRSIAAAVVIVIALCGEAAAQCPTTQSTPAFTAGGSVFGRIQAQWNAYFGAKADANNGVLCNPTIIGGSTPGAFTIGPGFTNTQGARNSGNNTISSGANFSGQLWPVAKSSSYIVNTDLGGVSDSGAVLVAISSGVTFSLPNPASGTRGLAYNFGSDGVNSYTVTTVGGLANIYGCPGPGSGATSYSFAAGLSLKVIDTGTAYLCTSSAVPLGGITQLTGDVTAGPGTGSQAATLANTGVSAGSYTNANITVDAKGRLTAASNGTSSKREAAIGWPAGIDPAGNIIITFPTAATILNVVGTVTTPVGATATTTIYNTASGTACGSGAAITTAAFNANGTAATNQTFTVQNTAVSSGSRLCLVTTDASNWTGGVGIGGLTVEYSIP